MDTLTQAIEEAKARREAAARKAATDAANLAYDTANWIARS